MKKSIIYLTISATLTFSGCDYLDDMPYDWAQPDDIFTNEQNYLKPINQVYAYEYATVADYGIGRDMGTFHQEVVVAQNGLAALMDTVFHLKTTESNLLRNHFLKFSCLVINL